MGQSKRVRRYAVAAYGLAAETSCLDSFLDDRAFLQRAIEESPELASFLKDNTMPRSRRTASMEELFPGRVSPFTWRFLLFLEEKRRLPDLAAICGALLDLHERRMGIHRVLLTSAYALADAQVRGVSDRLRARTGGEVVVAVAVEPSLLAGFRVKTGDTVYDLSVAGALRAAKQRMIRG